MRPAREVHVCAASEREDEEPTLAKGKKAAAELRAAADAEKLAAEAAAAEAAKPQITQDLGDMVVFEAVNELPPETKEIQPHPEKGVELGTLLQMLKDGRWRRAGRCTASCRAVQQDFAWDCGGDVRRREGRDEPHEVAGY